MSQRFTTGGLHPEYRQRYAANLRRKLPRIPFVSAGAKAPLEGDAGAAINGRSSTNTQSSDVQSSAIATVEERPFRAASSAQSDSRALAPEENDSDIFRAFVKAGQRLAEIHVHYEEQPEYPLYEKPKRPEKNSTTASKK